MKTDLLNDYIKLKKQLEDDRTFGWSFYPIVREFIEKYKKSTNNEKKAVGNAIAIDILELESRNTIIALAVFSKIGMSESTESIVKWLDFCLLQPQKWLYLHRHVIDDCLNGISILKEKACLPILKKLFAKVTTIEKNVDSLAASIEKVIEELDAFRND